VHAPTLAPKRPNERLFQRSANVFEVRAELATTLFTAEMIAIAIPAAIGPYSMAVAPDWSLMNDLMIDVPNREELNFSE
jgi:hypothetical protein